MQMQAKLSCLKYLCNHKVHDAQIEGKKIERQLAYSQYLTSCYAFLSQSAATYLVFILCVFSLYMRTCVQWPVCLCLCLCLCVRVCVCVCLLVQRHVNMWRIVR